MEPYIQEDLVTYVWYPMSDCYRKSYDEMDGSRITISQAMSCNTALRRYEHETEFMAHFDVDEFLQLPSGITDVKVLLRNFSKSVLYAGQKWYHGCNQNRDRHLGTSSMVLHNSPDLFPLSRPLCVSADSTPGKSIMRTKDVLGIFVHTPWVMTSHELCDWEKDVVEMENELFLAHVRNRRARDGIPIRNESVKQPLVKGEGLQAALSQRVQSRMSHFHSERS